MDSLSVWRETPLNFINTKIKREATINLAPLEIKGVNDSKLARITIQVEPQRRQSRMYAKITLIEFDFILSFNCNHTE